MSDVVERGLVVDSNECLVKEIRRRWSRKEGAAYHPSAWQTSRLARTVAERLEALEHRATTAESALAAKDAEIVRLREALTTMRSLLKKLQPALNIMAREVLDDIITDQIDPVLKQETAANG